MSASNSSIFLCIIVMFGVSILGENVLTESPPSDDSIIQNTLLEVTNSTEKTNLFTKWSPWSKCVACRQNRIKICIKSKCKESKLTEERPCDRRRCQRWNRGTKSINPRLNILRDIKEIKHETKRIRPNIWSRWSDWTACSANCTTNRIKFCKKPARCKRRRKLEKAFCFFENSNCEEYVFSLFNNNRNPFRRTEDINDLNNYKYETTTTPKPTAQPTHPKKKRRCGLIAFRKSKMLKIIGGTNSYQNKWPWHVAVINHFNETFCAGTLIAPQWVLTASHCLRPVLKVRFNEYDLSTHDDREVEMYIQEAIRHPRFNTNTVDNDLALLKLPRPMRNMVACLPEHEPQSEEKCSIIGWGKLKNNDINGSAILQEAKVPVVDQTVCREAYQQYFISDNMLCAGVRAGNVDTCAGDSGGGLFCSKSVKKRKAFTLQGITSFGDGCGVEDKYGIYTNVYKYIAWITNTMYKHRNVRNNKQRKHKNYVY